MQNSCSLTRAGSKSTNGPATKRSEPVLSAPHSPSVPPKKLSAPRRQSATISYRNSYGLGYWRGKCPSGSAGVPAEATGRAAAPTAVGESRRGVLPGRALPRGFDGRAHRLHILNRETGHRVHREFVDAETGERVAGWRVKPSPSKGQL